MRLLLYPVLSHDTFHSENREYTTMLQGCVFKNALLKAKGPSMGLWQTLPGANVSRILARAGVDWVLVDCEHGNIDGKRIFLVIPNRIFQVSSRAK